MTKTCVHSFATILFFVLTLMAFGGPGADDVHGDAAAVEVEIPAAVGVCIIHLRERHAHAGIIRLHPAAVAHRIRAVEIGDIAEFDPRVRPGAERAAEATAGFPAFLALDRAPVLRGQIASAAALPLPSSKVMREHVARHQ